MPSARMQAVWCPRYGDPDVLELREVPSPVARPGQVLVKVRAAAVTSGDARIRAARFPWGMSWSGRLALGLKGPRKAILGTSFAGEILQPAGAFSVGQRVFGMNGMAMGAHAEKLAVNANGAVVSMPEGLDFAAAAAISFGGTTALDFLRTKACLRKGERLMVVGASGQVGVAAVQVGRLLGAEVTAVCSGANAELAERLGAARVVNYAAEDVLAAVEGQDVVIDCANALDIGAAKSRMAAGARFIALAAGFRGEWAALRGKDAKGRRVIAGVAAERAEDLAQLADWTVAGAFDPVLSARFSLSGAAKAHRLVDSGNKVGSVVLELA